MIFEICVQTVAGVQAAVEAGAQRIELCSDLDVGGVTPGRAAVEHAVEVAESRLRVHVLVRCRPGDFSYDGAELERMAEDVAMVVGAGADGIVVGALTPDRHVDQEALKRMTAGRGHASVTFHRAFDEVSDRQGALETLVALGVERVLTSGGAPSALAGASELRQLIQSAAERIVVLPGGGITETTVGALVRATGAGELHFSASQPSPGAARDHAERIRRIMAAAREAAGT